MPAIPFTKRFREKHPRFTRVLLLSVCFFASFAAGLGFASWAMVCRAGRCPPAQALQDYEPRQTSKLLAVDGRFIAELGLERRTLVKIADNAHNSLPERVQALAEKWPDKAPNPRYAEARPVLYRAVPKEEIRLILERVNPHLLPELDELAD